MKNVFKESLENTSGYEEFKYVMQDSGTYYLGAKYTYAEMLEEELVPFKFKAIVEHYISKDIDISSTLESHLYYLEESAFATKTYEQLRAKVKVSVLEPRKSFFKKEKKYEYHEKIITIGELTKMNLAKKKGSGLIIRELILSKLSLMSFSV